MLRFSMAVAVAVLVAGVFAPAAFAQEADEFMDPGITPDSPWYFFDELTERARIAFTFNDEQAAKLEVVFADERIAEIRAMIQERKEQAAERAVVRYEALLENAEGRERSPEVLARIAEATGKHEAVLERVLANAPEGAEEKLAEVLERARERHEARFEELLGEDEQVAGRVAGSVLDVRLQELKDAVAAGDLTDEQAAAFAQKLQEKETFFAAKETGRTEFRNEFTLRLSEAYDDILELEEEDDDDIERVASRLRLRYETRLEHLSSSDPALGAEAVAKATERIRIRIEQRAEGGDGLLNAANRLETVRERIKTRIEQEIEIEDEVEDEENENESEENDELGGALERLEQATQNRIQVLERVKEEDSRTEQEKKRIEESIKQEEREREELKQRIEERREQQKREEERRKEEEKEREDQEKREDKDEDNSGSGKKED